MSLGGHFDAARPGNVRAGMSGAGDDPLAR